MELAQQVVLLSVLIISFKIMIIAFYGSSGSGKSTLIKEIKKSDIFQNRDVVIKEEDNFFIIKLFKKLADFLSFIKHKKYIDNNKFTQNHFISYVYALIVYLEFVFIYIKYEIFYKNKVLLKDRYIYDYIITLNQNNNFKSKFINYLFCNFPKPSLIFFVDVNRSTAIRRNANNEAWMNHSGNNKKFHENILNYYIEIANKINIMPINNNGILGSSIEIVKNVILIREKLKNIKRIVICGIDGTGKTTLVKSVEKYLDQLGIKWKEVHFYHNCLLYQFLLKLGYFKKGEETDETYALNRSKMKRTNKKRKPLIWAFFHFLDAHVQYLFSIIYYRNRVIIFDRFFYDFIVNFKFYRVKNRNIFENYIPNIKNRFCLICDPEVSYKRKPENTLDFFRFCYNEYIDLVKKNDLKLIDTTKRNADSTFNFFIKQLTDV